MDGAAFVYTNRLQRHGSRYRRIVRLHPTRPTFHVALAGATLLALGIALRSGAVVTFAAAMILAVAVGRGLALTAVTRLRAAGFEMVWSTPRRVARTHRGGVLTIEAELRNRGIDDIRGIELRVLTSAMLRAKVEPKTIDLPPESRVFVKVTVEAKRVGRWGVHGMALEVRGVEAGGESLYEVPLMFANPFGIEVLPLPLKILMDNPSGGRARRSAEQGRPSMLAGEGDQLKELREHVPGDPFKRIAWKASAKRGRLVVREMERDQRDVVWVVVDSSVELWSGEPGAAPLDRTIDDAAAVAARHLTRGDRVGLVVTASRLRSWITPASGPSQINKIAAALASAASCVDADRSDLDEHEVAARVAEHARPLDARGLADLPRGNLDMLAARAESLRNRAPFAPRVPFAPSSRERTLRHYLASFGVEGPPRLDGEREKSAIAIGQAFDRLLGDKARPSIVYVFAPAPTTGSPLAHAAAKLRRRQVQVRWSQPDASLWHGTAEPEPPEEAIYAAVQVRSDVAKKRGDRAIAKAGARLLRIRPATKTEKST